MAFIAISFAGFSKEEAGTTKKPTKNTTVKIVKKIKADTKRKNVKAMQQKKEWDCYPVQINASCGTFYETMCSAGESTPIDREEAFEVLSDMYDNAVCN